VNWRYLLPLPLAAFLTASPLRVPPLKPIIPEIASTSCDYSWAKQRYLEAYAYARENPRFADRSLTRAGQELSKCKENVFPLKSRIKELEKVLFPAADKPRHPPP
jgi:hypothetical protein